MGGGGASKYSENNFNPEYDPKLFHACYNHGTCAYNMHIIYANYAPDLYH